MSAEERRTITVTFGYSCDQCGRQHGAAGDAEVIPQPMIFGGATGRASRLNVWLVRVRCPTAGEEAEQALTIPIDPGSRLVSFQVANITPDPPVPSATTAPDTAAGPGGNWLADDLRSVQMSSPLTLRTFATTMLTTSTGAVAVYFAVINYLDGRHGGSRVPAWLGVSPAVLLLAASAAFAWALRPALGYVTADDYAEFRRVALVRTQRRCSAGLTLLLAAVVIAVAAFSVASWQ
jgi:hypothetical protein